MNLKVLLKGQVFQPSKPITDDTITGVSTRSKDVEPGHLYIAARPVRGIDLQEHIQRAVGQGARFILKERSVPYPINASHVIFLDVMDTRMASARIAANLFPGQPEKVVAVTGTNGKTSTTYFLRQIWEALGEKAVCMGTTGLYGNVDLTGLDGGALTSPDPFTLHRTLSTLKQRGCTHVALEASSHGLDQRRLDCLDLMAAAFTNLTHDHLDYHQNMDKYFEAKMRLFSDILPEGSGVVLNNDDFRYAELLAKCRDRGHRVITFGRESHDIRLVNIDLEKDGQILEIKIFGSYYKVYLPLIGAIQAYNVLCAFGLAILTGAQENDILEALAHLKSAPGRFEWIGSLNNGAKVFVDFAHTPHALEMLLTSLRPHIKGEIHLVFGCGGDRDQLKRPIMGEAAAQFAEHVYVTDDNPRTEDASAIRSQILQACPGAENIADRQEAIIRALSKCAPHDVCVIAGKGHEQGQIIGEECFPFDDRLIARQEIERLNGIVV